MKIVIRVVFNIFNAISIAKLSIARELILPSKNNINIHTIHNNSYLYAHFIVDQTQEQKKNRSTQNKTHQIENISN